jgi:hypothetical protein
MNKASGNTSKPIGTMLISLVFLAMAVMSFYWLIQDFSGSGFQSRYGGLDVRNYLQSLMLGLFIQGTLFAAIGVGIFSGSLWAKNSALVFVGFVILTNLKLCANSFARLFETPLNALAWLTIFIIIPIAILVYLLYPGTGKQSK